jgi:hypothetical protein
MELCSDGHDEVCFEARRCPVCEVMEKRDEVLEDLRAARAKIEKLEDELSNLEDK